MTPAMWVPPGDLNIVGIFIPSWLLLAAMGFAAAMVVVTVLERQGWTKYVWHLPLFFVALVVTFSCILALIVFR